MLYEKLEEASKIHYENKDFERMSKTLEPLDKKIRKKADTPCERQFIHDFGNDLDEAYLLRMTYRKEPDDGANEATLNP